MTDNTAISAHVPLAGELGAQGHILPVRVYWEDTDAGGIVYHANYLKFMERARTDYLRLLGVHQSQLQRNTGITLAVSRMNIAFRQPAVLDDLVQVVSVFAAIGGASLTLAQKVLRGNAVLAQASVTVAALREGRPVRLPPDLRALFAAQEQKC